MLFENLPIRGKLIATTLLTSGVVVFLSSAAFISYDFVTFRFASARNITTLGQIIATNSTASLAFDNAEDAADVLSALRAEPHVVQAGLYNGKGELFARYSSGPGTAPLPASPGPDGLTFTRHDLIGVEPVLLPSGKRLGALFLRIDQKALYERLTLYGVIAAAMLVGGLAIAYVLSRILQQQISRPILMLARTARSVSEERDYSVRAQQQGGDELGRLTGAFNQMLERIQDQDSQLRESGARIRAVVDSALSAVIVMSSDGRISDWNMCAEQMFGWSREEAIGQELAALVVPERYREAHRRGLRAFGVSGEAPVLNRRIEMTALRYDGSEFPVELSVSAMRFGDTASFCGFVTDITEQVNARNRIQGQLARLDLLHRITHAIGERQDLTSIFQVVIHRLEDNLPIDFGCIAMHDEAGQTLSVMSLGVRSREIAMQIGMAEGTRLVVDADALSLCGQGRLVHEPDIAAVPSQIGQQLARGGMRSLVITPLMVDGRLLGILIAARRQAASFLSADCEFLRQLCDHVALASHQARLYGALQKAYDELRETQRAVMQQERLRALSQMASGVAHDINNAISPVALYTEALLENETGLSERARNYLITIQRAIDDVAGTVSRMREFYRPQENQLEPVRVSLNRVVPQVVELTRVRWRDVPQQRGVVIDLRVDLAADLPHIMGAENEIRDALTNLIFNATDAMPEGGQLLVRTRTVTKPSPNSPAESVNVVCLEVIDAGSGMDEHTARHCLEPFFTTKGERGTGLGLAMVYGMAQRHGAQLEIESALGKGTTVRLVFAAVVEATDPTIRQPVLSIALPSLRVLVVDDDPLVVTSVSDTLRSAGHDVTAAGAGQAGIDTFLDAQRRGEPFAAVITDLGMPYVDGRQVAAAIKRASPDTPVILLTGWGQRLKADNQIPPFVDCVLNKPPKLRELRTALAELTAAAPQARVLP